MALQSPILLLLARAFIVGLFCFVPMFSAKADENRSADYSAPADIAMLLHDTQVDPKVMQHYVLSDKDVGLYRRLFAAQVRGDKKSADEIARKLDDNSLVDWARVRRGRALSLWLPGDVGATPRVYRTTLKRSPSENDAAQDIAFSVGVLLKTDDCERALDVTRRAVAVGTIDRVEGAQLLARVAGAMLYNGHAIEAQKQAHLALQIAGVKAPQAAWIAGLSSWMLGETDIAAQYFAWVPRSPYAGPWMRSAAAFWTARAMMMQGHYSHVSAWLQEAAKSPRSFYGLIATRALGSKFDFTWTVPQLTDAHLKTLRLYSGAVRALKLAQAGQMDMARIELTLLDAAAAPQWREALAALALKALKPDAVMAVSDILDAPDGRPLDLAQYPLAPWNPHDGYRLEPALLHAFARQESGFKPSVSNAKSGATGLLQLMPRTAQALDKKVDGAALKNPRVSLSLGQKYLEDLLSDYDGNLFDTAIAYNAGPGNLAGWKARLASVEDPLLFIELIPYAETRAYVERVMANYWIYSLRMGHGVPSLEAVASGKPAIYAAYMPRNDKEEIYAAVSSASNR